MENNERERGIERTEMVCRFLNIFLMKMGI
jgi:hypothetical protein